MALIKTSAIEKAGNVDWDGAQQSALTLGPAISRSKLFGGTENATAGEAAIYASSLHLLLRDLSGTIMYEARGGIELLQQLSITNQRNYNSINFIQHFADLAPTELFRNPDRDVLAVDVALHDLLMSPADVATEGPAKLKGARR